MKPRDLVLLALLGGAAYFLLRRNPATGRTLADDLLSGLPLPGAGLSPVPVYAAPPSSSGGSHAGQIVGIAGTVAATAVPLLTGGGAAAVAGGGGAAAAGAAGIGLTGALAATGVAAGAAILAWGIIQRGWFRGGEEGVKVNPARDAWFDYFIKSSSLANVPTYGKDYRAGAQSIQDVRYNAFLEVSRRAHVPEGEINRILTDVYNADTMREWEAAAKQVEDTYRKYESQAVVLGLGY